MKVDPTLDPNAENTMEDQSPDGAIGSGDHAAVPVTAEFLFRDQKVRTVQKDGETWFVAVDVCAILEHTDPSKAVSRLDDEEKGANIVRTLGGDQQLIVVNESGLFGLTFTSRKPEAKAFRRWVTKEVLPSIRKTGRYEIGQENGSGGTADDKVIPIALPGPGRFVVTILPNGRQHIHQTGYEALEHASTATDTELLAHTLKTIECYWHMIQQGTSIGCDADGKPITSRLETTILDGGRLGGHYLRYFDWLRDQATPKPDAAVPAPYVPRPKTWQH